MRRNVKAQTGLTRDRVVDAALQLADRDGLEALSLRPLAKALGVTGSASVNPSSQGRGRQGSTLPSQ